MELLLKAHKQEESPYNSVNDYVDTVEKYCKETTTLLIRNVASVIGVDKKLKKSNIDAPLIFKGRIQYSPRTGKPITESEWNKLEDIIIKYLRLEKKEINRKMASDGYWLGSILAGMEKEERISSSLSSIDIGEPEFKEVNFNDYDYDRIRLSEQLSGIYIQNVNDRTRSKIQQIISDGSRQHSPNGKVWQNLWDLEQDVNRDWERVVRTEVPTNINNGLMTTLLRTSDEEYTFVKGISAPGACKHCERLLNEKVFVLLEEPPKGGGDKVTIDGKEYTALWSGKSNFGRKPKNYWACFPLHPYGRCSFTEWYLELEQYLKP